MGANCELKIPNKKKSSSTSQNPTEWIIEVVSKREDNKDLLLSFESKSMAYVCNLFMISYQIYLLMNLLFIF